MWWTILTTSTATFGPNPTTDVGRIVGTITMFLGIGITSSFTLTLAAGLTKSRIKGTSNTENNPGADTQDTISKGRNY